MSSVSKQLIGNEFLLNLLLDEFESNNLNNSIIISGTKGIGKNTFVFNFISKIFEKIYSNNFEYHKNLIYNKSHTNFKYIHKIFDEKTYKYKKFISIDQIRSLESFIFQSSFDNNPKFVIIDSADDLNNHSANGILKILEEPKDNTYFILIAHQFSNLLPTIRSRCVKYNFIKPTLGEFNKIMKNVNSDIDNDQCNFLYNISNSSPGIANEIFSENINDLFYIILNILKNNKALSNDILGLADIVSKYKDEQFRIFLLILRFVLISITKINLNSDLNDNFSQSLLKDLQNTALNTNNEINIQILEYLNNNENDLFTFNLDKKIFTLNIFSSLNNKI